MTHDRRSMSDDYKNEPVMGYSERQLGVLGRPLPKAPDHFETIMTMLSALPKIVPESGPNMARAVAAQGRGGDTAIAHLTPGEMVIPKRLQTSEVMAALKRAAGGDLARLQVGHPANRVNPRTGAPEFDDSETSAPEIDGASQRDMGTGDPGGQEPGTQVAMPKSLISPEDAQNLKDAIANLTNGGLTSSQIDDIYDQTLKSLGPLEALSLQGIDGNANPISLTPRQMGIINAKIQQLDSPDLRVAAQNQLNAALTNGKVTCPKCGGSK